MLDYTYYRGGCDKCVFQALKSETLMGEEMIYLVNSQEIQITYHKLGFGIRGNCRHGGEYEMNFNQRIYIALIGKDSNTFKWHIKSELS